MKKIHVVHNKILTVVSFKFSAIYTFERLKKSHGQRVFIPGKIVTELTIDYKQGIHYLKESGRYYAEDATGNDLKIPFKVNKDLEDAYQKLFDTAVAFGNKKLQKK